MLRGSAEIRGGRKSDPQISQINADFRAFNLRNLRNLWIIFWRNFVAVISSKNLLNLRVALFYSHSIVPGGLEVMS
jgi:hypothetical protein